MKTIKLGLYRLNASELLAKGQHIVAMMTSNASFDKPTPSLTDVQTSLDALHQAISAAVDGGKTAHELKRQAVANTRLMLTQLSGYVFNAAAGDPVKILSTGFDLREHAAPISKLDMPQNLRSVLTDFTGQVELRWQRVHGATNYQVFVNGTDPSDEKGWELVTFTSQTRFTAEALTSTKFYWFRVQAMGRKGLQSPNSDVLKARAA